MMKLNQTPDCAWTIDVDAEWVAWLVFNLPGEKVNKLTATAMEQLEAALDELAENEEIKAIAIRSDKRDSFIVGADIHELSSIADALDARAKSETGHRIFGKIASMPVPTVAVIHGACMGGGLELALACTHRVVTDHPRTSLGLPEVKLGILPGWGGTQRLPRLIGLPAALGMMLTGKPASGKKAVRIGLADGIVNPAFIGPQTRAFIDRVLERRGDRSIHARRRQRQPRTMRLLQALPPGRRFMLNRARRSVMERTAGMYPAPLEILRVVRRTYGRGGPDGFREEAKGFSRLAVTPISRHLVRLFLTSQKLRRSSGDDARRVAHAGVVGAGIMGGGIAWAVAKAGVPVRMKDLNWPALVQGKAAAAKMFRRLVDRRSMTPGAANLALHRISCGLDWSGFGRTDIVIEAVVEDLDIKKKVLAEIEANVGPDTVIATNTSSLPLRDLATALQNPKRFVGLHFFNPVNRMQLVEVVPYRKTSKEAVVVAADLVRQMGKMPVVVGDCPGFLVNRILLPYLIESTWMVEEGIDPTRIDHALEAFGMPMGPLALVDEVGIDTGYKVAKVLESAYGPRMNVASVLGEVVETGGLLGKKSGRGFYLYDNGSRKPNHDVNDLVATARARDGHDTPATMSEEDIVDRAVLIMVNEAARCIDEGIATDPETLDTAMVLGTGFAPFRGGLLRYADECGLQRVCARLEDLAARYGERFRPVPLIERLAHRGGRFHPEGDV